MSLLPFDTLIRGYTREEAFEIALDALEAVSIPARSWRRGGVMRGLVGVVATMGSIASQVVAEGQKSKFLGWATEGWLTYLAKLEYNVDRIPATFAAGQITFTNQGGGVFSWGADEVVAVNSATGARYRITTPANGTPGFPVFGAFQTRTFNLSAIEAGSASSSPPGAIDSLETTMARVVVGNEQSVIGTDEESDEALTLRCSLQPSVRSANGPREAWEFAALSAKLPNGNATSINRARKLPATGDGTVRVICATPSGAPTSEELKAVRDSIEDLARTDSDNALVEGAIEQTYSRTITIWRRGGDEATVRANAQKALAELQVSYPIGGIKKVSTANGYLWEDAIESAIIAANKGVVFDVDQTGGDIELAYDEIPVIAATLLVRVEP